ncbi:hypothetical protein [Aeromonas veronii]|uniref:hypothetical protein n=1 Tax=Aeromonas veronii TaxID=654 RepID=UPI00123B08D2|nr:hypothetical protein [Aeromonas veronii]QET77801.1 hypothetical protein FOB40_00130 [Aeromonas veronii]
MHTFKYKDVYSAAILLLFGVLPPVLGSLFGASSMAEGVVVSISILAVFLYKEWFGFLIFNKRLLFFLLFFIVYVLICNIFVSDWNVKANMSAVFLFFILHFSYFLSKSKCLHDGVNYKACFIVLFVLVLIALFNIFTGFSFGLNFYGKGKAIFPFGEPSHYAIFLGPFFIAVFCQIRKSGKFILLVLMFLIVAKVASTTLFIYLFLALLLMLRSSLLLFLASIPLMIGSLVFIISNDYYYTRFIISPDSDNLTALVYLQGLQDAYQSFVSTYGVGLGFQMLGTQPISPAGMQIGNIMNGVFLNRQDGGFLAAKLIAEFGVLGIIFLLYYIRFFVKSFIFLSGVNVNGASGKFIFCLSCVYCAFVELFVRGAGYFTPTVFFLIVAVFLLNRTSWNEKHFIDMEVR